MPADFFGWVGYLVQNDWSLYLYGVRFTLILSIVGTLLGLLIGLVLGTFRALAVANAYDSSARKFTKHLTDWVIKIYVWVFRGSPMMVQAILIYYALKPFLHWDALVAGLAVISINTGAYMVEIIRSGIQAVPHGQNEAALTVGMTEIQAYSHIILPQALINTFPSIGNQLIVNIKDSSMLNVIGVIELFFQTTSVAGTYMRYIESFAIATVLYLLLTSFFTWILNLIERKISGGQALRLEMV
ncbi:MAG: amino acid ABC transporter permease [Bifidobacteriaceae bacterium]|jgi:putative lysine transport system permease protein|nr:amino acid ABC transporter permease [Bifidobacteriaceae bacterium]